MVVIWAGLLACSRESMQSDGGDEGSSTGHGDGVAEEHRATESATDPTTNGLSMTSARGVLEKGPFVVGSKVTISPLNAGGGMTGQQFEAFVSDDGGSFADVDVPAGLALLEGTGFHFDEVEGGLSEAPLAIRAVLLLHPGEDELRINVLTHLVHLRVLNLVKHGVPISEAATQAQQELVSELGIGIPGLVVATPAVELTIRGPDDNDHAYLLALGAVLIEAARQQSSSSVDATLQELLNSIALALADDGRLSASIRAKVVRGEHELDGELVMAHIATRLRSLGIVADVPNVHRVLDQDGDGLANREDNCPHLVNADQLDQDGDAIGDVCDACPDDYLDDDGDGIGLTCDACPDDHLDDDGDGVGPTCDPCPGSGMDSDRDGTQDACDNCPLVANAQQMPDSNGPDGNSDDDAWGDACDSCPLSHGVGGTPNENCCDPRDEATCGKTWWGSTIAWSCRPIESRERFDCQMSNQCSTGDYGAPCIVFCGFNRPCIPEGGLCDETMCNSKWCTVGDDVPCAVVPGTSCIPWFADDEAPDGLTDLGICARASSGPCTGTIGRLCAKI